MQRDCPPPRFIVGRCINYIFKIFQNCLPCVIFYDAVRSGLAVDKRSWQALLASVLMAHCEFSPAMPTGTFIVSGHAEESVSGVMGKSRERDNSPVRSCPYNHANPHTVANAAAAVEMPTSSWRIWL